MDWHLKRYDENDNEVSISINVNINFTRRTYLFLKTIKNLLFIILMFAPMLVLTLNRGKS